MAINDIVVGANLQSDDFNIGTDVANSITINVDGTTVNRGAGGLSSADQVMSYNNATQVLTLTRNDGAADTTLDLSALAADIFVDGASFDGSTGVLTLTDAAPGTPDVTVDLSSFQGVSTDANNLLSDGTDGKPLLTGATICTEIKANCIQDCILSDVFSNTIGTVQMAQ